MTVAITVATAEAAEERCLEGRKGREPVFPYWSSCSQPALYSSEVYKLQSVGSGMPGFLSPEWNEDMSTYCVRLSEQGAFYRFRYRTRESRPFISEGEDLMMENADNGRVLSWRQEGKNEFFLVEEEESDAAAMFQLSAQEDVSLACPRIEGARCRAYNFLASSRSSSAAGMAAHREGETIYIRRSNAYIHISSKSSYGPIM
ncbi:hypothetical protein KP509_21G008400 [Ceratopteris richardii]|uniref:Uncharacterized protein n=1 Tax=Ceratopteris richardii TaxID=49495 RepID=A0A8T2S7I9_CERRI|nr:hypothetical protein KP509_21G008300 [Ceratopteris richardii]KAH7314549.1 hypothetical protein KP509_21G008400 [Ceratopteris richardii]